MMSSHNTLGAMADDRKARLAKLKSLKRKQPEDDGPSFPEPSLTTTATSKPQNDGEDGDRQQQEQERDDQPPSRDVARLHLSGRNYDPETRGPKLGFESAPTATMEQATLEEQAAEVEREVRRAAREDEEADKGIDLFKLQPKKPNWDLKRELARKMEVLNVRTDNAIARLVRERLAAKKAAPGGGRPAGADPDGAAQKASEDGDGDAAVADGGLEGAALVEGMRLREQEEEEERRREKEEEMEDGLD